MITEVRVTTNLDRLRSLYEEHATALFRLGVALTGDKGLAEDLVHDAFIRFQRLRSAPAAGTELAYLRRTVLNLANDHHRHAAVVRRHGLRAVRQEEPSAETAAVGADTDQAVGRAIAGLPSRQRACVVLHYFAGLSDADIAADLGISVGSVKTHLHRARAALAARLEDLR